MKNKKERHFEVSIGKGQFQRGLGGFPRELPSFAKEHRVSQEN
jgi:hypothetical protein